MKSEIPDQKVPELGYTLCQRRPGLVPRTVAPLSACGVKLRPGEPVAYIVTDAGSPVPAERACAFTLFAGDRPYDSAHYAALLARAFEPFTLYAGE